MIKCVILDDEPLILRGIKSKIERFSTDFQIVATANDGMQGIEMIKEQTPDVVFTDIRMPLMDGLELIGEIRKISPETLIVILSGYRLFDYAQKAIQLGVEDYLVKPINPVQLNGLLTKIRENFYARQDEQMQKIVSMAVKGEMDPTKIGLYNQILYSEKDFSIVAIKICIGSYLAYRFYHQPQKEKSRNRLYWEDILMGNRDQDGQFWLFDGEIFNEKIIICRTKEERKRFVKDLWKNVKSQLGDKASITFIVSEKIKNIEDLFSEINSLEQLLYRYAQFEGSKCIYYGEINETTNVVYQKNESTVRDISRNINILDTREIIQKLFVVLDECQEMKATQREVLKILGLFLRNIREQNDFDERVVTDVLVFSSKNYKELKQNLERLLLSHDWLEVIEHDTTLGTEAIVDRIALYIRQHREEKISVHDLAKQYNISHSYLCIIFKKYMNMSPNEYIIMDKLEYAKRLLVTRKDLSVGDVSMAVGYDDPYYFSRIFKTNTGLTPSGYRKIKCQDN